MKHLKLTNLGFAGPVSHQLGNLSCLHTLDLSFNSVTVDKLDWLSGLSSLRYLNLSGLNLSKVVNWPQSISKLPSLLELELNLCSLRHVNPRSLPFINSSTSLEVAYLIGNRFSSYIFFWLSNVSSNLVHVGLHENQLKGPIPDVFTSMVSLVSLVLSSNQLDGGIPKSFLNLCRLESLQLGDNRLSDRLQDSIRALSCSENSTKYLDLSGNKFWRPFPNVTRFSSLTELHMGTNNLMGTLRNNLGQLPKLERMSLYYNKLSGSLPDLTGLPSIRWLRLSNDEFSRPLHVSMW